MRYFWNAAMIIPLMGLLAAALYLPFALWFSRKRAPYPFVRHVANYLLLGYFLMLIWVVFFWTLPALGDEVVPLNQRINLQLGSEWYYAYTQDGGAWSSQVMWNVFLFVPLGALLPCVFPSLRKRAWLTVLLCLALTCSIECVQGLIGRIADVDDVFCNLLGGLLGRALYTIAAWIMRKCKWTSPVLTDTCSAFGHAVALAVASFILLVPSVLDVVNRILPNGLFG